MAKRRAHAPRTPHQRQPRKRQPNVPSHARDTAGAAFGHGESGLPARSPHPGVAASHAIELIAPRPAGLFDVLLELAGAEHGALHQTLAAWQREQDRVVNRAWRRPGGLARPAGL